MKTGIRSGEIARILGIDRSTVTDWTDMKVFKTFFSETAFSQGKMHRRYNETDLVVLNTIRYFRAQNMDFENIGKQLEADIRIEELPLSAASVQIAPVEAVTRAIQLASERNAALQQVKDLQTQIEEKEQLIDTLREENKEALEKAHQEKDELREKLMREMIDERGRLSREIGKLEAQLEIFKEKHDNE
jgi:DNA-binding transcriptional MerR regulator